MPPRLPTWFPLPLGLLAFAPPTVLWAQNDRWHPVAADTSPQARSATPSPLRTWQVTLPLRRGIELWAGNPTPDSIAIPSVDVWDCVNIDGGCGRTLLDTVLAPGDSLTLLRIHPRHWNAKYRFRWTHYWAPLGPAPSVGEAYVLPAWAVPPLDAAAFVEHYGAAGYLTPRTLEPDLDGDGETDLVILIQDRQGARGLAILLRALPTPVIIGAGHRFGPFGTDFTSLDGWDIAPDRTNATNGRQAVRLRRSTSVAGYLLWTPAGYAWQAQ